MATKPRLYEEEGRATSEDEAIVCACIAREQDRHDAPVRAAIQHGASGSGGVHDRENVLHLLLERRSPAGDEGIRHAEAPTVKDDEPRELCEMFVMGRDHWIETGHDDAAKSAAHPNNVRRTGPA